MTDKEEKLDDLDEELVEEKPQDYDEIKPGDQHRPFSTASWKRWRKGLMGNLNQVLQTFQRDLVTSQARVNLAWNGMNAVILALVRKGLVTNEDVRQAGVELMKQHNANLEKTRTAIETGTGKVNAVRTPLEEIRDDMNAEAKKMNETKEQ